MQRAGFARQLLSAAGAERASPALLRRSRGNRHWRGKALQAADRGRTGAPSDAVTTEWRGDGAGDAVAPPKVTALDEPFSGPVLPARDGRQDHGAPPRLYRLLTII